MENKILNEDSRNKLLNKSKSGTAKGRQRYNRRLKSHVSSSVRQYNDIDMNKLFKEDILTVGIEVKGETDNYVVTISFGGLLEILKSNMKRNNQLDLRNIIRSLVEGFNQDNVYIHCNCLHKDTPIKLLDGTCPTVEELKKRFDDGEKLYAFSADKDGNFKPGEIEKVWITNSTSNFVKVTLDDDSQILTTPEHLYMLRDGSYEQSKNLKIGQSLMSMYFDKTKNGYDTVKYNSGKGKYHSIYKLVSDYYLKDEISESLLNQTEEQKRDHANKILLSKIRKVLYKVIDSNLPITEENYEKFRTRGYPTIKSMFNTIDDAIKFYKINHKIKNIEFITLQNEEPVYDIKVKDWNNFTVGQGVVLHNCPDAKYRFDYWQTKNDVISKDKQTIPSDHTNPHDSLGSSCKHVLLVLANTSWLIKVASVINNYIMFMKNHREDLYAKVIYPAIYDKKYQDDYQLSLNNDDDLINDKETIDTSNEEGRTSGQFKTGNDYRFKPYKKDDSEDQIPLSGEET